MKKLIVYGRDGCEPCASLKTLLTKHAIPFTYVDVTTLGKAEADALRKAICAVTGYETATVPAAEVSHGSTSVWISNWGLVDVSGMFAEIQQALE